MGAGKRLILARTVALQHIDFRALVKAAAVPRLLGLDKASDCILFFTPCIRRGLDFVKR